jgi:hypothetical protein
MARYWLGDKELDRWVLRAVKADGGTLGDISPRVCARLLEAGEVKSFQKMPDETDIWCALQRLTRAARVRKISEGGVIKYFGAHV